MRFSTIITIGGAAASALAMTDGEASSHSQKSPSYERGGGGGDSSSWGSPGSLGSAWGQEGSSGQYSGNGKCWGPSCDNSVGTDCDKTSKSTRGYTQTYAYESQGGQETNVILFSVKNQDYKTTTTTILTTTATSVYVHETGMRGGAGIPTLTATVNGTFNPPAAPPAIPPASTTSSFQFSTTPKSSATTFFVASTIDVPASSASAVTQGNGTNSSGTVPFTGAASGLYVARSWAWIVGFVGVIGVLLLL